MDRGAWRATVRGVTQSQTRLSNLAHTCLYLKHSHHVMETPSTSLGEDEIFASLMSAHK